MNVFLPYYKVSTKWTKFFVKVETHTLKQCIEIVKFQHQNNKNDRADNILFNIETAVTEKLFMYYGCECGPIFRTCRNGKEAVETSTFEAGRVSAELHPYSRFTNYDTLSYNIQCMIGEPDFENPNSYQSIIKVIQKIGIRVGISQYGGTVCKWLFVECDGLPYQLILDIIENVWKGSVCTVAIITLATFMNINVIYCTKLLLSENLSSWCQFQVYFILK